MQLTGFPRTIESIYSIEKVLNYEISFEDLKNYWIWPYSHNFWKSVEILKEEQIMKFLSRITSNYTV